MDGESFWEHVDRAARKECWLWTEGRGNEGYGRLRWRGESQYAHRAAWEITHGPIPSGAQVLHRCDVPLCVNPTHLYLGTIADNMADRENRGHGRRFRTSASMDRTPKSGSPHGTVSGYVNHGCRCRPCTTAWTAYQRDRRHRS